MDDKRLQPSEIQSILNFAFELPCIKIELRGLARREVYQGSGTIRQETNGELKYTIICTPSSGSKGFESFLLGESYFYQLTAVDIYGREWFSKHYVSIAKHIKSEYVFLEGHLNQLSMEGLSSSETGWYQYYIDSKDLEYPSNKPLKSCTYIEGDNKYPAISYCVAEFEYEKFSFRLSPGKFRVKAEAGSIKTEILESRFIEALEFVCGTKINCPLFVFNGPKKYKAHINSSISFNETIIFSPLHTSARPLFQHFWDGLFIKYFNFICKNQKDCLHEITPRLSRLRESHDSQWETRLLTSAVELEGLIHDFFNKKVQPPVNMKAAIDKIFQYMNNNPKEFSNKECNDQIKSSLGLIKSTASALNKLKHLGTEKIIDNSYIGAWKHIRNKSAHADHKELEMTLENRNRLYQILTLFYQIIFYKIGYAGKYYDYSVRPKKLKSYPLTD